jgi:integrase
LLFLYRNVLRQPLDRPVEALRARKPKRLPTVLTKEEALRVIGYVSGPCTGAVRRHHASECGLQRAISQAGRAAGLTKYISCHTFRLSFAMHLLQQGYDIRTVQELLGHKDVKTTMIYTHVLNRGRLAVRSPLA